MTSIEKMYVNLALTFQVIYYFKFLIFVGPLVSLPKDDLFFNNCFWLICCSYFWDCLYFCQQLLVIDLNVLLEHDIFISLFFRFSEKTCGPPPSTDHANLTFKLVYGSTWQATYHCLPGFAFLDATNTETVYRHCSERDGEWPSAPTCG